MNPSRRTVVPLSRKWMTSSTWEQECRARKRTSKSEKHLLGKPSTTWGKYGHLGCQRGSNWDSFMQLLKQSCCMDPRLGPSPKHCPSLLTAAIPTWLGKWKDVTWKDHITNAQLYRDMPPLTEKIKSRRLRLAGHCHRHPELPANKLIVWEPNHGKRKAGRPIKTLLKTLIEDSGVKTKEELANCMKDKDVWRVKHRVRLKPPYGRNLRRRSERVSLWWCLQLKALILEERGTRPPNFHMEFK